MRTCFRGGRELSWLRRARARRAAPPPLPLARSPPAALPPILSSPALAARSTGHLDAVIAGDTAGNIFASYPLAEDGNYKFWVFSDAYKGNVTKEDGSEVEEDIYEAYNLSLLFTGQKDQIPPGHGIRINGEKYMHTSSLKGNTYQARIGDASREWAGPALSAAAAAERVADAAQLAASGRGRRRRRRMVLAPRRPLFAAAANPRIPIAFVPALLTDPVTIDEVFILKK